jgi:hypothetical protein
VTTAVLSDLHVGGSAQPALAEHPAVLATLADRIAGADHVVLLGDVVELRDRPLAAAVSAAEPLFRMLGDAVRPQRVTIVPGNHDHQLAGPLLEARRLEGPEGALAVDRSMPAPATGPLGRFAGWLGGAELVLAYPGTWIRDDVFATHGHYLDCHNTVPTLERLGVAVTERAIGGLPPGSRTADDYEAAVGPLYSLSFSLAQATGRAGRRRPSGPAAGLAAGGASIAVWRQVSGANGRRTLAGRALSGVVIPGAVAVLNRAGLGPLSADLSGAELRRAALRGMVEALARLDVDPPHALFGHTHRSGPWAEDDGSEWGLRGGGRLVNVGSWVWQPTLVGERGADSPYWPGTCAIVEDEGPPRLERLLEALPAGVSA